MAAPLTTLVEPSVQWCDPSIALRIGTECYAGNGAPVLTVQTILGHQHVDTTLGYARLYDGTVAADYYRAMAQVEQRFVTTDNEQAPAPNIGELLALVDSLRSGTVTENQLQTIEALRVGILSFTKRSIENCGTGPLR